MIKKREIYKAHIRETTGEIQTVKAHCEATAELCRTMAIPPLKDVMYAMGLLHDVGKFQETFQERIDGKHVAVEHSACGAIAAGKYYRNALALMIQFCIAGHHGGLPDGGTKGDSPDMATLAGRLQRNFENFDHYQQELAIPQIDEQIFNAFLMQDCDNSQKGLETLVDKFAFITRYCFSCLVDADSLDTAQFCERKEFPPLTADFEQCLHKINQQLERFKPVTVLQKSRAKLQQQVYDQVGQKAEIYIMDMPTGSGKTLCSMKFALERAIKEKKSRIIYVIPYNSIIEQTVGVFEKIFGEDAQILRHQSTFSYEDAEMIDEDYRLILKRATENWDARIILTTAVQFFESLHASKRGRLRKVHNMADSILVFDEVHTMPRDYLQPCLESITYLTRYCNSEAIFLTATMPDFKNLIQTYALADTEIKELIPDKTYFDAFKKCCYRNSGVLSKTTLIEKAQSVPSALVIVNKRKTARELYALCGGKKYHLSTYMTAYDRNRVIEEVKVALAELENQYPNLENVPESERIILIATSLVEAGVDLDFHTVFRELAGVDNILQAGGRCNREGKRQSGDVFIFELNTEKAKAKMDSRAEITKGILSEYDDITSPESICTYYKRLLTIESDKLTHHAMYQQTKTIQTMPFRTYAEQFRLIDTATYGVVAVCNTESAKLVETIRQTGYGNSRRLQPYAFSVYANELETLEKQHVIEDYGSGIYCLTNSDYYDSEIGIQFEGKDYFI